MPVSKKDAERALEIARGLKLRHARRDAIWRRMRAMLWGEDSTRPSFPKGIDNPQWIDAMIPRSVVRTLVGMYAELPRVRGYALGGDTNDRAQANTVEDFHNQMWKTLRNQAGTNIYPKVVEAAAIYGVGVEELCLYRGRMSPSNGYPDPEDSQYKIDDTVDDEPTRKGKLDAFGKKLDTASRKSGTSYGKLPLHWRHVPSLLFYFDWDDDAGDLTRCMEVRQRPLADMARDPKFKGTALVKKYTADLKREEGATGLMAEFCIVQDGDRVYHLALPGQASDDQDGAARILQDQLGRDFTDGDVVDAFDNDFGRPTYHVTFGLESDDPDPALRWRSVFYDVQRLVLGVNALLSYGTTQAKDFMFPAAIITNTTPPSLNGQPWDTDDDEPASGGAVIEIPRGAYEALELPYGKQLQFIAPPPPDPNVLHIYDQFLRFAEANTFPRLLTEGQAGASYAYIQGMLETGMYGYKTYGENLELSHLRRTRRLNDAVDRLGGTIQLQSTGPLSSKYRQARWLKVSPKDLNDDDISFEAILTLHRPEQSAQDLQNYMQAVQSGAYTRARAREIYLHEEESEHIEDELLEQQYLDDPTIKQIRMQMVTKKVAAALLAQQQTDENAVSPDMLQAAPPGLMNVMAQRALPGTQAYDALQAYTEASVGRNPPMALGPGGAAMPSVSADGQGASARPTGDVRAPVPGGGGRARGQAKRPGGAGANRRPS